MKTSRDGAEHGRASGVQRPTCCVTPPSLATAGADCSWPRFLLNGSVFCGGTIDQPTGQGAATLTVTPRHNATTVWLRPPPPPRVSPRCPAPEPSRGTPATKHHLLNHHTHTYRCILGNRSWQARHSRMRVGVNYLRQQVSNLLLQLLALRCILCHLSPPRRRPNQIAKRLWKANNFARQHTTPSAHTRSGAGNAPTSWSALSAASFAACNSSAASRSRRFASC